MHLQYEDFEKIMDPAVLGLAMVRVELLEVT